MGELKVIEKKPNQSAISLAEELVERLKKNQWVAFTAVVIDAEDNYEVIGSASKSRSRMAGMLLDAAIIRLRTPDDDG